MMPDAPQTLVTEREKLISNFLKGDELSFLDKHTRLFDNYFCESFEKSMVGPRMDIAKNPYAIIALGGYGRKEQCIFSDVDLLFLFKTSVPPDADALIREIVYPLWDIGLDVGHATRSISECIKLAEADFEVLTSLLEGRFICGLSILYSELMETIQKRIIRPKQKKIISMLVEDNRKRHERFGDSTYRLEPNIKEGQGGLRDYHTMLWIARIKSSLQQPRDLVYEGYLSHEEYDTFSAALAFIWTVRNRLHHLARRKCDQLHFEYQIQMAKNLGYKKEENHEPVEQFLGDLHGQMEYIKQHYLLFITEHGKTATLKTLIRNKVKMNKVKGIAVIKNMLSFTSPEKVIQSPELLMEIFRKSAMTGIPLSAEARRIVKEFSYLVDDSFRASGLVVNAFEDILLSHNPKCNSLDEMLNTKFIQKMIPEFETIVNRIQYDEYHVYPVDKHILKTVQTIQLFEEKTCADKDQIYSQVYHELADKKILLLWGALLHDIGKSGEGGGHAEMGAKLAVRILQRSGYGRDNIETVSFLVKEHLFLIKIATRRDINSEETAILCARTIKDVDRLKMLYLLTVADSASTGPKAWNDWTETLLRDLFLKVLNILEKGELASKEAVESLEKKKEAVLAAVSTKLPRKDMESLFEFMSPRYLLYADSRDIIRHAGLYKRLNDNEFVWSLEKDAASDTRTVTICAKDRPGLFSKIAGVFTLNNLNILDAQIFTWKNRIALDIFRVTPPPDRIFEDSKWIEAESNLKSALSDELDLLSALKEKMAVYKTGKPYTTERPTRVKVDNESSGFFTIIEVFTYDFPGLLFRVTDALYKNGLDIWVAKIATKVDQVVDVFYVRSIDGEKVDSPEKVAAIQSSVKDVITNICFENKGGIW